MKFIQNRSLGYDKENVVIIPIRSDNIRLNYNSFRNELLSNSQIISVSASADIPSDRIYGNTGYGDASQNTSFYSMENIYTDYDFVETYKMKLLAGRSFSRDYRTDTTGTIMLNESAVIKLGWTPEEAIGKELSHRRGMISKIVGVVSNFNFKSLHNKIEPLVILLSEDYISYISVRINIQDFEQTLKYINQSWHKIFSNEHFEYGFLNDRLVQLYEREQKMNNIFLLFSFLSILIACMGLLGLATFMTEDRTKEIGIRKVLGASELNIIQILSNEFLKWVLIANIVAWPIAWFAMNRWLQNFAYKIELELWMFVFAGCLALIIAIVTVSVQAIRAAIVNPVESLRYE
jgi:putative ABC transport system permease protein